MDMGYGVPQQPQPMRNDPQYVAYLEQRIVALETRLPRTNIVSPKFWTRAWAIYGHLLALSTIISLVVFAVALIVSLVGGAALFSVFDGLSGY